MSFRNSRAAWNAFCELRNRIAREERVPAVDAQSHDATIGFVYTAAGGAPTYDRAACGKQFYLPWLATKCCVDIALKLAREC